jgi:hypothetical protein
VGRFARTASSGKQEEKNDMTGAEGCRWLARGLGLLLFLLWGSFFVAHLGEWFLGPRFPPPWVWFMQALHLGLLLGYLAAWRWELPGAALILVCGGLFFTLAGAPLYAVPSVLPGALLLLSRTWRRRTAAAA